MQRHLVTRPLALTAAVLATGSVLAGCGSGDQDKAGAPTRTDPVELVLANHDSGDTHVAAWADAAERLSRGSLRIRIASSWRRGQRNYDKGTLEDVREGKVALAAVPARSYDEVGVTSFQPLVAPLLIDDRDLERTVLRGDIGRRALAGTAELGLVGLALVPGDQRRPVGLSRALVGPEDYRGARLYTREGRVARETFEALGAHPLHRPSEEWSRAVDGAEANLGGVKGDARARRRARITTNVVLWPHPVTVVMDKEAFEELSGDQRAALRAAGDAAFDRESKLISVLSDEARGILCRVGAEFVEATPAQLAALRAAVEPVHHLIARGSGNAQAIAEIHKLKGDATPERLTCRPDASRAADTGARARALEGTFRASFSEQQLADSPHLMDAAEINDENWGDFDLRLSDGTVRLSQRNDLATSRLSGRYTTDGDTVQLEFDEIGETFAFRWSVHRGTLRFERDDALGVGPTPWLVKPWRRVR